MNGTKFIKMVDIESFKDHSFVVEVDNLLQELAQSIKDNGLLNPVIVRTSWSKYEMIYGHRRLKALEIIDVDEVEAYVKDLTDDEATIFMVDSNLQRKKILPSERAFAYRMKMDALKYQGRTLSPKRTKQHSAD